MANLLTRNPLEARFKEMLAAAELNLEYEVARLPYVLRGRYTPDFTRGNVHIEIKGYWSQSDRRKIKAVRLHNPDVVLIMVFQRPYLKISKNSQTSYADWCDRWGILWIPFPSDPTMLSQCLKPLLEHTSPAPGATAQMELPSDVTEA